MVGRLKSLALLGVIATAAYGQSPTARVGDVTHLQGQGINVLIGYGLVTGLNGSGDGGKFLPTMTALAAMMERFGTRIESINDIQAAKNVGIAMIEVVVPENGVREGETLDVTVTALAAKSLEGGRLLSTPLIYHARGVKELFGFAQGAVEVPEGTPNSGTIKAGARMERDVFMNVVATGSELVKGGINNPWIQDGETYITLVIDEAHSGWSMAAAIAQAVDKELSISANVDRVALAVDSKNVVVLLPKHQSRDLASWVRDVERTPILMESNEARVAISRKSGTIVVTGDTRLSPVVVSQLGMTVTIAAPLPDGSTPGPSMLEQDFVALDSERARLPNVKDLLEALNRLKVPFKDRVSILEQIHRAGKLHARIIYEG